MKNRNEYTSDHQGNRIYIPKGEDYRNKFIQAIVEGNLYLEVGDTLQPSYHGEIFKKLLEGLGVQFEGFTDDKRFGEIPISEKEGVYSLTGAGTFSRFEKNKFELSGKSGSYHIGPDRDSLIRMLHCFPEGSRINLEIRGVWEEITK